LFLQAICNPILFGLFSTTRCSKQIFELLVVNKFNLCRSSKRGLHNFPTLKLNDALLSLIF